MTKNEFLKQLHKHLKHDSDAERQDILNEYADQFDLNINLVTIDDFGGWDKAYEDFFQDGAIFDEIYSAKN